MHLTKIKGITAMTSRQEAVNKLFEKLIVACKEHGFSANQISLGMQYMGAAGRNHCFRDGNTHAKILLSLNPLKATLVKEFDPDGALYWDENMLKEYRLTDEDVEARSDEQERREKFARTSKLWLKNRDLLVSSFNQPHGSKGKSPNDTAMAILKKLAAKKAPEYMEFVKGIGSDDIDELKDFLLEAYFDEDEDKFWAMVLGHKSYPKLIKLSIDVWEMTEKNPKSAVLKKMRKDLGVILLKIYDDMDEELSDACSPEIFSSAPFYDKAFRDELEEKKRSIEALKS
jgi:hypothetical protein